MAYQYRARGIRGRTGIEGIGKLPGHDEPEVFMISSSGNCGWCELDEGLVNVGRIDFGAEAVSFCDEDIEGVGEYLLKENAGRNVVRNALIKSYDMERIDRGTYRDLSGVYFDNCSFHADYDNANFEDSIINRTCSIRDAEFTNCTFRNAELQAEEIVNSRFMHNNFNHAQLVNVRMKDCILDTNDFEEAHFYNTGLNSTVVKDNSFLSTTVHNSYLHHIEAYDGNRHVDTIHFEMGGTAGAEFEKARNDFLRQLNPERPENISDVPWYENEDAMERAIEEALAAENMNFDMMMDS